MIKKKLVVLNKKPAKRLVQKAAPKIKASTTDKFSKETAKEGANTLEQEHNEIKRILKPSSEKRKEAQSAINMSKLNKKKK